MGDQNSRWYSFCQRFVHLFVYNTLGGITTVGEENVPLEGPVLFAPNHLSHLDPPIVACSQHRRQLTFMSKAEMFKIPILGRLIRSLGAFPVRRGESDTQAIRASITRLEEGRALLIFPEGKRGEGKVIQPFTRGLEVLAKRTGAQVVPVGIINTHKVLPKGHVMPKGRYRMTVAFGKPFTYDEVATYANEKDNRKAFSEELTKRIVDLCRANGYDLKTPVEPSVQV